MPRRLLRTSLQTLAVSALVGAALAGRASARPPAIGAARLHGADTASSTPASGYLLVGKDGSAYPFGAQDYGSVYNLGLTGLYGSRPLAAPVVGAAVVPGGGGYWMTAADGGIFTFGDAGFYGNTYTLGLTGLGGSRPLAAPIVGMAPTPDGRGYWLVAADGGVFTFGDAGFYGNTYTLGLTGLGGSRPLAGRIVGIDPTPDGQGYTLIAADGGVFTFGDAPFEGSTYGYGYTGLGGSNPLAAPVIAAVTLPFSGFDVSNWNCTNLPYMPPNEPLLVVQTNGWPFAFDYQSGVTPTCSGPQSLAQAVGLGGTNTNLYLFGGATLSNSESAPLAPSFPGDSWNGSSYGVPSTWSSTLAGQLYALKTGATSPGANFSYGWAEAEYAMSTAVEALGLQSPVLRNTWWLDVETGAGTWSASPGANTDTIDGALAYFESIGVPVGVYSTSYQWDVITAGGQDTTPGQWGAALPAGTPLWIAAPGQDPTAVCTGQDMADMQGPIPSYAAFGGGTPRLVQYGMTLAFNSPGAQYPSPVDLDASCP